MSDSLITRQLTVTLTGAAVTGILTVASTTGLYAGANGTLISSTDTLQIPVVVVEILSATTFSVKTNPNATLTGYPDGFRFQHADLSAYSGGKFTQYPSVVNPDITKAWQN